MDIGILQPLSWVAAAIGVCVAAFYYAMNLRETTRNRRATFANNILQDFQSWEGILRWIDLASMKWSSFDDFTMKYDSSVNKEHAAKRLAFWNTCEAIGYQYRSGTIDLDTIFNVTGGLLLAGWVKFKPIMEGYRKLEFGNEAYSNWEYLADMLLAKSVERDKDFEKKMETMFEFQAKSLTQ